MKNQLPHSRHTFTGGSLVLVNGGCAIRLEKDNVRLGHDATVRLGERCMELQAENTPVSIDRLAGGGLPGGPAWLSNLGVTRLAVDISARQRFLSGSCVTEGEQMTLAAMPLLTQGSEMLWPREYLANPDDLTLVAARGQRECLLMSRLGPFGGINLQRLRPRAIRELCARIRVLEEGEPLPLHSLGCTISHPAARHLEGWLGGN